MEVNIRHSHHRPARDSGLKGTLEYSYMGSQRISPGTHTLASEPATAFVADLIRAL